MTEADVREYIRYYCLKNGGRRTLALRADVSVQYISDVIRGNKPPSKKILHILGLRRIIRYEEIE